MSDAVDPAAFGLTPEDIATESEQPAPPAEQPAPAAAAPEQDLLAMHGLTEEDVDSFLQKTTNPATNEARAEYANGLSPDTPINDSPLSIEERRMLALGNDQGRMKFLQEKFGPAAVANVDGDFRVQQDGVWHRVSPKGWGGGDAWETTVGLAKALPSIFAGMLPPAGDAPEMTFSNGKKFKPASREGGVKAANDLAESNPVSKELAGSYAAAQPALTKMAMVAALPAEAPLAAIGAVGAASSLVQTSLGRLVDTYDATPEEQIDDALIEGLFNFGGAAIPMGVKPVAGWVGDKLPIIAKTYNSMDSGVKEIIASTYGAWTVGKDNFKTMLEDTPVVASVMKSAWKAAESGKGYLDEIATQSRGHMENLSKGLQPILSKMYEKQTGSLINGVDNAFAVDLKAASADIYDDAIKTGIGELWFNGTKLSPIDAQTTLETIRNGTGSFSKGIQFRMKSFTKINSDQVAGRTLNDMSLLGTDQTAYRKVSSFFEQLNKLSARGTVKGRQGAQDVLTFRKLATDATYAIRTDAKNEGQAVVANAMAKYAGMVDNAAVESFEKHGLGNTYKGINESYSTFKKNLAPAMRAADRSSRAGGDTTTFGALVKARMAADGERGAAKDAVKEHTASLLKSARTLGIDIPEVEIVTNAQRMLKVNDAAIAFNPIKNPGIKNQYVQLGTAPVTSPRGAGMMIRGGKWAGNQAAAGTQMIANSALKTTNFVRRLTPDQLKELTSNPAAVGSLIQTTFSTTDLANQTKQALMSQVPQQGGQ